MSRPSFALSLRDADHAPHLRHLGCFTAGAVVARVDVAAALDEARVELAALFEPSAVKRRRGITVDRAPVPVPAARATLRYCPGPSVDGEPPLRCGAPLTSDPRQKRCPRCARRAIVLRAKLQMRKRRAGVCPCGAKIAPVGERGRLRSRCDPCRAARTRERSNTYKRKRIEKEKAAARRSAA